MEFISLKLNRFSARLWLVPAFTLLGFAVMGYHPGFEDDGIYLAAVKADLHPALYPHNAGFVQLQVQGTVFPWAMAHLVRLTHLPVAWAELLVQLLSLFLMIWACHSIAERLFAEARAQWAGVALVTAMFTLPVSGTALYLADQHLHPRNVATALILLAVARILAGRRAQAALLLAVAFLFHPLMAALGVSFCLFLSLALLEPAPGWLRTWSGAAPAMVPLGWIFEPPNADWRRALDTRTYYYLYQWTWYEWLGALAPLALFWLLWRVARRRGETLLARFALAVFVYGVFQQVVAMIMLTPAALIRLTPLQPMRYLHLVYFFLALLGGGLLGRHVLKTSAARWAVFLLVINGGMFAAQRSLFQGYPNLELPGQPPTNQWMQAFAWIRQNTPADAYFALDPYYLRTPGEDYHSFRALAERDQLADAIKDAAVVTQVPELGPVWWKQVKAEQGWAHFRRADFERLKVQFGVDWVLAAPPQTAGMDCPWKRASLSVCHIS